MIKTFDEFINEAIGRDNGVVLVLGPEVNGEKKLFMLKLKKITELSHKRVSGEDGKPARMATLYPELFLVREENGILVANKMAYTKESLKRVVGLSGFNVTLNSNKTPLHYESIDRVDWKKFINDYKEEIKAIPKIKLS